MTIVQALALFGAAILGGAINSVAGGGTFVTFPTLLATGIDDKIANATNTMALWPGSAASVGAYRKELTAQRHILLLFSILSLVGGYIGARVLLNTPQPVFRKMVPFLLLFATLLFTFGNPLMARLRARRAKLSNGPTPQGQLPQTILDQGKKPRWPVVAGVSVLQFTTAFYGGFFGGGIGIVMLAILNLIGMQNIHEMNALKTWLTVCINGAALVVFIGQGAIVWPQAILMIAGAIIGGFGGAYYARQIDPKLVRRFVIVVAFIMTAILFYRAINEA